MKVFYLLAIFLFSTALLFSSYSYKNNLQAVPRNSSRDFVAWMKTVPISPQFGGGMKNLVINMNPSMSQADADAYAEQITEAAKNYPDFCNSGNNDIDMAEFSAFLSIVGAETSFNTGGGFPQTVETGCPNCDACSYDTRGKLCLNNTKLQYFGRGPLQLSWNYNYAAFSKSFYNDENVLLNDPDKVTSTGAMSWASAIWFWMTKHDYGGWCMPPASWPSYNQCNSTCYNGPQGCSLSVCTNDHWLPRGKGSCHDAMVNNATQGFGEVINLINGGYDCCPSTSYASQYGHITYRMWWFLNVYQTWTNGQFPINNLNPAPLFNCPLGEGKMDCSRLASGTCWSNCCSLK